jgi:hypothetical protein
LAINLWIEVRRRFSGCSVCLSARFADSPGVGVRPDQNQVSRCGFLFLTGGQSGVSEAVSVTFLVSLIFVLRTVRTQTADRPQFIFRDVSKTVSVWCVFWWVTCGQSETWRRTVRGCFQSVNRTLVFLWSERRTVWPQPRTIRTTNAEQSEPPERTVRD